MTRKLIFIIIISVIICGCFRTRPIEPPDTLGSTWQQPTSPDILLTNFRTSIQTGDAQNYFRCFTENNFRFSPAPSVVNGHESIWQNWSRYDEQTYFSNLKAKFISGSPMILELEDSEYQNLSADSVQFVASYRLRTPHTDTTLLKEFRGQLNFTFTLKASQNEWEITNWTDIETHPDSCWSKLKLHFIQ